MLSFGTRLALLREVERNGAKHGNRTRILPLTRDALTLLSYQFDNRSAAARSKLTTDKRRVGIPATLRLGRDLNPLAVARFTDNPILRPVENEMQSGKRLRRTQESNLQLRHEAGTLPLS